MKFKKHCEAEIQRRFSAGDAERIMRDIEARYIAIYPDIAFARTSSNPLDRRLEVCAYLLATIRVMEARGLAYNEIRAICVAIAESYVRPANFLHRWLKRLPAKAIGTPLALLITRLMAAKVGKKGHPDGFLVQVVTAPAETNGLRFGFDILECGICTLFQKHGALEYVPILCEVDLLTTSMAGLTLIREGTIASGAAKCDFRFTIAGS
jgi:hypothetical protein